MYFSRESITQKTKRDLGSLLTADIKISKSNDGNCVTALQENVVDKVGSEAGEGVSDTVFEKDQTPPHWRVANVIKLRFLAGKLLEAKEWCVFVL